MEYSYKRDLTQDHDAFVRIREKLGYILRTLGPCEKARELGFPEHEDAPLQEHLIVHAKIAENETLSDKERLLHSILLNKHYTRYFTEVHRFVSEIDQVTLESIDKLIKKMKHPSVYIRDYDAFPEGAEIMGVLATRFNGRATKQELKLTLPHHMKDFDEKLERCKSLWRGIITIDPENDMIHQNEADKRSLCATLNKAPLEIEKQQAELYDKINTKISSAFYILSRITDGTHKEMCRQELEKYYNKPLSEYPTLLSKDQVEQLSQKNIHTAIDFLNLSYSDLKYNSNLTKYEIINAKFGLASRTGHDPSHFEIDLVHPSVAVRSQSSSLYEAIRNLKDYFDQDIVTFGDLVTNREIMLSSKTCKARKVAYKIVAFVRYFVDKCKNSDPFRFDPLTHNWRYSEYLSKKEFSNIKLDDSELIDFVDSPKPAKNNTTAYPPQETSHTEGGIGKIQTPEIIQNKMEDVSHAK